MLAHSPSLRFDVRAAWGSSTFTTLSDSRTRGPAQARGPQARRRTRSRAASGTRRARACAAASREAPDVIGHVEAALGGHVLLPARGAAAGGREPEATGVLDVNRFYPKTQLSWLARLDHSHCNSADPLHTQFSPLFSPRNTHAGWKVNRPYNTSMR